MRIRKNVKEILDILDKEYGSEYVCYLNYETPWQLLFATILSAQCTDARVNVVTKDLFVKYPTLEAFANANQEEMEMDIKSTGFYKHKAKNIIGAARILLNEYDGKVPDDIDKLTALPGVGRKTANVFLSEYYNDAFIAVDTHVERVSKRLGLAYKNDDVFIIEKKLMRKFKKDTWAKRHLQLVLFGRYYCKAIKPECKNCLLSDICKEKKRNF